MTRHAVHTIVAVAVLSLLVLGLPVQAQDKQTPARNWDTKAIKDWFSNGVDGPRNQEELARAKAVISMLLGFDVAEQLHNLGVMYNTGRGVSQDDAAESATWYRKAAEQGLYRTRFLGHTFALRGMA